MLIKGTQRHNLTARIGPFTDQGCFLVAFFTGVISILSLKYLAAPQLVVTGVPVLIMLSYLALMLVFRRMRVDDDQAGDNLYYLGFLFTLTSLGCALFQYNGSSSKESIIQNFGIALATTIVITPTVNQPRSERRDSVVDMGILQRKPRHILQ